MPRQGPQVFREATGLENQDARRTGIGRRLEERTAPDDALGDDRRRQAAQRAGHGAADAEQCAPGSAIEGASEKADERHSELRHASLTRGVSGRARVSKA